MFRNNLHNVSVSRVEFFVGAISPSSKNIEIDDIFTWKEKIREEDLGFHCKILERHENNGKIDRKSLITRKTFSMRTFQLFYIFFHFPCISTVLVSTLHFVGVANWLCYAWKSEITKSDLLQKAILV